MTTEVINIISSVGFPIVLVLIGINAITKHAPSILSAWQEFTKSLDHLSSSVAQNSAVTQKHYEENITVQDHLKKAIALLEEQHDNAEKISEDIGELRSLFIDLAEKIQSLQEEK